MKAMKNYKKPKLWICVAAVVACIILAVGFLTNPKEISKDDGKKIDTSKFINEYAKIWREGEYPSLVKFQNTLYVATDEQRDFSSIARGTIKSRVESGVPTENFQTNDDLVGCEIYTGANDYIGVLYEGQYISYKNVTADDEFFSQAVSIPMSTDPTWKNRAAAQDEYLSTIANAKEDYFQYYGGITYSSEESQYIIWLTEINDDIVSFYDQVNRFEKYTYQKCDVTVIELNEIREDIENYLKGYTPSSDEALNELVESISGGGTHLIEHKVYVHIVDCTEEKIALFKEKINDSEHIYFENMSDFAELH